jgi:hypothetical protein
MTSQSVLSIVSFLLFAPAWAEASQNTFGLGAEYYNQNAFGRITKSDSGSASSSGVVSYPVQIRYSYYISPTWFVAPQLSRTLLPRESADKATKTTMTHLSFNLGSSVWGFQSWEWSAGPGIISYTIKGKGGIKTLNNGTSTSDFALPSRSVTVNNYTFNLGTAVNFDHSRLALQFINEALGSSGKRSLSYSLAYCYLFGGAP